MKKTAFKWLIATILVIGIGGIYDRCSNMGRSHAVDTLVLERTESLLQIDTVQVMLTRWKEKETKITDTIEIQRDTVLLREAKRYQDSLILDSGKVKLDVFLSGVDARLDSTRITAEIPTLTIEKTIEKEIYIKQPKRFKDRLFVAPSVGVGYGLINNKADVYIGVSAGIKL